uniref:Enoyl reductase (ER) domain-containing protein n=1 Tax=Moniliophthora roreri TaxID=221103 RepID=A0A0W0EY08_MONRR
MSSEMPSHYAAIVLNERPEADIIPSTFRKEHFPTSELKPKEGEVVLKILWLSLDPAMRGWLRDQRSYLPPVQIGEVMRGGTLSVVIEKGPNTTLDVGTTVYGWREYAVVPEKILEKITTPPGAEMLDFINTLGSSGMTAYFGLHDVGKLKKGETLVVSGAAGSVGSIVCQLGKRAGAKVFAIAGSQDKCEWLENEIGVDKAFNYKSPTFRQDFKEIGYLDVFFDNVGGEILDMCLSRLNRGARIVLCGAISAYNSAKPAGIHGYLSLISQRARIEGFIVFDYKDRYPEAIAEISKGLADGSIKRKFHVVEGLENAPAALPLLFNGGNTGKLVVKVSDLMKANL